MRKEPIFLLLVMILSSCDGGNGDEPDCCFNLRADIDISVVDVGGNDLLSPSGEAIDTESINVYFLQEDGSRRLVNNPDSGNPKGYRVIDRQSNGSDYYSINLQLNTDYLDSDNISSTYIEWEKVI